MATIHDTCNGDTGRHGLDKVIEERKIADLTGQAVINGIEGLVEVFELDFQ